MKKFVLQCNRCTVATRSFNLSSVHIQKEGTLGTSLMIKIFFALNLLIFLLQTDFEEISKLSKMARKREKTFIQLNWSQNEKAQLEKGMQAFCFFIFGI